MKQKRLGKRIAAWLLCLAMVLTTINLPVFTTEVKAVAPAGTEFEVDGIKYKTPSYVAKPEYKVSVSGYTTASGAVTIPSSVIYDGEAYDVKSILNKAFKNNTSITSVTLPDTINSIVDNAFSGCVNLETVIAPKVKDISYTAFNGCTSLTTVVAPELTEIFKSAFWGCTSLQTIDTSKVTFMDEGAFQDCTSLESINLSSLIEGQVGNGHLSANLFWGCTSLSKVTIPASITNIDSKAFLDCSTTVEFLSTTPPAVYDNSFGPDVTFTVPCGAKAAYESSFENAGVNVAGKITENHDFDDDGVCKVCEYECTHKNEGVSTFVEGKCSICSYNCVAKEHIKNKNNWLKKNATEHEFTCSVCGTVVTENHDFSEQVISDMASQCEQKESCSQIGIYHKVCELCSALSDKTFEVEKLEHNYVSLNNAIAATCTEAGHETDMKCTVCEDIKKGAVVAAKGHTFDDGVVTKEPSYDEAGEKLFTCQVCKATEKKAIDKLKREETPVVIGDNTYNILVEAVDMDGKALPEVDLTKAVIHKGNKLTFAKASDMKLKGYTFKGFYLKDKKIKSLKESKLTDGMIITAKYSENTYSVTYKLTKPAKKVKVKGKIPQVKSIKYTEEITISDGSQITVEGYKIIGWTRNKKASEVEFKAGATTNSITDKNKGKITLYPIWEKVE